MTFQVTISQGVTLDYSVEYRVRIEGVNPEANIGIAEDPGEAFQKALMDALLEKKLGALVTK